MAEPSDDTVRTDEPSLMSEFHCCVGSLPLCKRVESGSFKESAKKFEGLLERVRERLETFPNVKILYLSDKHDACYVRFPRVWTPVGESGVMEDGPWVFCEHPSPLLFRFHLPVKLQESLFPAHGKRSGVEDFTVAYDGMIFICVADVLGATIPTLIGPMVRKYIQRELFKSVDNLACAVIPPSPMHLTLDYHLYKERESPGSHRARTEYDPRYTELDISSLGTEAWSTDEFLKMLYSVLQGDLRSFYHAMIDLQRVDSIYSQILDGFRSTHSKYGELLDAPSWRFVRKLGLTHEVSARIGGLHQSFCEHTVSLAYVQEERRKFLNDIAANHILSPAVEYFAEQTKPTEIDCSIFLESLGHMRSHLLVFAQNRYLVYATVLGSLLTLVGTMVGYLLTR